MGFAKSTAGLLLISLLLAAAKLWTGAVTGSSAVFAEAVRSLTDLSGQALLLGALARSGRSRATCDLTFWATIVPVLLYAFAAGVAVYEGIDRINRPRPMADLPLATAVLGLSLSLQAVAAWVAIRMASGVPAQGHAGASTAQRLAAGLGLPCAVAALLSIVWTRQGGGPEADGIAAIAIGAGLSLVAALMALEAKRVLARSQGARSPAIVVDEIEPITPPAAMAALAMPAATVALAPAPVPPATQAQRQNGNRKGKGKRRRR